MSVPINPIVAPSLIGFIAKGASRPDVASFQNLLSSAIKNVESAASTANVAAQDFLSGGSEELHSTILASQSADLDFELFTQVRNKVVSAYEEIMKMQV